MMRPGSSGADVETTLRTRDGEAVLIDRGRGGRGECIMTRRSRGREVALQVLYQLEQNSGVMTADVRRFIDRRLLGEKPLVEFTLGLIQGVREHQPAIDEAIKQVAENWRLDRMAAIDRNILRVGAFEILHRSEVPAKVAINEALELAKRYSTAQSSRFVNGILDKVLQLQAASSRPAVESEPETEPDVEPTAEAPPAPAPPVEEGPVA